MDDQNKTPSQAITPSRNFYIVTNDDDNDLPTLPKGLMILSDGDLMVRNADDVNVGPFPVKAGWIMPIRPRRVMSDTTATVLALA